LFALRSEVFSINPFVYYQDSIIFKTHENFAELTCGIVNSDIVDDPRKVAEIVAVSSQIA
jgi:hypothetical protein